MRVAMRVLLAVPFGVPGAATEARTEPTADSRFSLRASFQPEPKAVDDGRYRLRGQFTRELRAAAPIDALGFELKASFAPKSTCVFPSSLFQNGFESTP